MSDDHLAQRRSRGHLRAVPPRDAPALLLFDGDCGLCQGAVAWLLVRDRERRLRFAPLSGETARSLPALAAVAGARHGAGAQSAVLVEGERVWLRGRAVLRALAYLPPPWCWAAQLQALPAWLLDPAYRLVARHRRRLCGVARPGWRDARTQEGRLLP